MKKILVVACLFMAAMLVAVPGFCDTLITPASVATYTNPAMNLPDSNPSTEEMFLENILGLTYDDPSVFFVTKEEGYFTDKDEKSLSNWIISSASSWVYAVVKVDGKNDGWYAYLRDDSDGLGLTVPSPSGEYEHGISHVSFFGQVPVPEPSLLFLLGAGLVGIGATAWRKVK